MPRFNGVPVEENVGGGRFGGVPVADSTMQPQIPQEQGGEGFLENVAQRWEGRRGEVTQTFEDVASGDINPVTGAVQVLGKGGAGAAMDVIGEAVNVGVEALSDTAVGEKAKELWDYVANTDLGKRAGEAILEGADAYNKFKLENPQEAKTIESVVNIGLMFAPAKARAKAEPTVIGKASNLAGKSAGKQIAKRKTEYVSDLITPPKTKKVKIAETARTTEKGVGPFKRSVIELSPREKEIASEVMRIKNINSGNTVQANLNHIHRENTRIAKKLDSAVARSNVAIDRRDVLTKIDDAVEQVVADTPIITGNVEATVRKIVPKVEKILEKHPETAKGLLDARKELDAWARRLPSGEAKLAADAPLSAQSIGIKAVRNAMNDIVDARVKNTAVKRELKRQSLLYDAIENIAPKAAEEYNTAIGRAWQNSMKVIGVKNKLIQDAALVGGISAFTASAMFAPYITAIGGGAAATGIAYKALISPKTKILAGKIINAVDKAILSSKNPSMVKQLRADRALIVEMLKNSEVSDEAQ